MAIGRSQHLEHHTPPFDTGFGILNGWSNGVTAKLGIWNALDRLYWRTFGKMPNNWIQDPRSIPPEAIADIEEQLELIPQELWEYGNAFPGRVPDTIEPLLERSKEAWRLKYAANRRDIYQQGAQVNPERALREWEKEQRDYPWIFGETPVPLFEPEYESQVHN